MKEKYNRESKDKLYLFQNSGRLSHHQTKPIPKPAGASLLPIGANSEFFREAATAVVSLYPCRTQKAPRFVVPL